ncbi:hypothetical protein AKJ40_02220 [candidate division MSBL1 archaeon SCGC-AAA259M10]|uniref:Uncharacterized protein n=2 Tax=candidate division MSBL1 TaxID=215777 RepID=A0A133U6W9_9EURY|nr:hypothetical protein AKJ61_01785 [candidate division MSBL1 archaeon SCGC-AAA259B11]KXA99908.1 hypothetical protein AKJ40_02220 [candidate division MSBL1 archaeon SCGC-AAA259M10]
MNSSYRVSIREGLILGKGLEMPDKEREIDRFYELLRKGWMPRPLKIFLILVSMLFAPIFFLIDKILEEQEN